MQAGTLPGELNERWQWAFKKALSTFVAGVLGLGVSSLTVTAAVRNGWLSWRGPEQTGISRETGLPDKVSPETALWVADYPGQSAPLVADGRVYAMGYTGQGPD